MLTLKGHTKKINWLANYKNPLKKREVIVSCSSDCTVVVWLIRPEDLRGKKKGKTF